MFKLFSFFALCLFSVSSFAVVPTWVYRVDTRDSAEIFADGFSSWGNNNDFISHLTGNSRDARNDIYISTSDDLEFINELARDSLASEEVVWEYTIRPSESFFNILISLDEAISYADHNPTMTHLRDQYRRLRNQVAYEREFPAIGWIRPSQIYQARPITYDAEHNIHYGEYIINPYYDSSVAPTINTNILPTHYPEASGFITSNSSSSSDDEHHLYAPSVSFLAGCNSLSKEDIIKNKIGSCDYKEVNLKYLFNQEVAKISLLLNNGSKKEE